MRIKFLVLLLAVAATFVAFGVIEAAGQKNQYASQETGASSSFSTVESDGTEVYAYISASDYTSKDNGSVTSGSSAYVDVYTVDINDPDNWEDDVFHEYFGSVDLAAGDLVVSKTLSSAVLQPINLELCEYVFYEGDSPPEPECVDVTVNMNWGNADGLARDWGNSGHQDDSGCRSNSSYNTSYRNAVATGSVVFDGQQLVPGPADFASIYSSSYKDSSRGCDFNPCADGLGPMSTAKVNGRGRDFVPANVPNSARASAGCSVP